jgi:hypothetical protein
MAQTILQINYRYDIPRKEFEAMVSPVAHDIAKVSGLRWKVWLINEEENEAGGLYLFDDEAHAKMYLESPIVAGLREHPGISDVRVKQFNIMEAPSQLTRGPLSE